jgi:protein-L-isoaspartate(D-aspartate) O-methyltransferase
MRSAVLLLAMLACRTEPAKRQDEPAREEPVVDPYAEARTVLVNQSIVGRDIKDPAVIAAMRKVPRHEFVPGDNQKRAYEDTPLAIGFEQTISQPYIVAAMSEAAHVTPGAKVLEIGTGSGYQAAVLAEMGADVYSIEIVEPLAKRTHAILARLGYTKLHLRIGDGYAGWPEAAPFDAIIVTAAAPKIPQPLIDQLKVGARLVIPVGEQHGDQELHVITKTEIGVTSETLYPVRFVPMTCRAQGSQGSG